MSTRSWKFDKLSNCCTIVNGSTPSTSNEDYWNGNIVWFTPTDLGRNYGKYINDSNRKITESGYNSANTNIVPKNNIILSTRAPIGHIAINSIEACTNQGCKSIIPNGKIDVDYLYYYLFFSKKQLNDLGSGTTFLELSTASLLDFIIPQPPLEEQKRIVKIIETKLTAVEKAKKASEEQCELIKALFSVYLKNVLSNNKWKTYKLIELCDYFNDGNWIESKDQSSTGIRLIQTGNIGNGFYVDKSSSAKYISKDTFDRLNCSEVYPDDILISRLPKPVGRACIVPELEIKMVTAVDCTIVRTNKKICDHRFLMFSLMNDSYFNQVNLLLAGATRERISRKNLENVKITIPPLEEQKRIVKIIETKLNIIENAKRASDDQSSYINTLTSSILRKAFNGEY